MIEKYHFVKHHLLLATRPWLLFYAVWLVAVLAGSCSGKSHDSDKQPVSSAERLPDSSGARLRKVTLMPYWVTSAQFAGFYMGIEKGIFRKHSIDLEVLPFDPFKSTQEDIENGNADFSLLWLVNAIKLRSQGVDIVNIAQFSSRSSLMLLAKKSSGIRKISDLNGKKAAIWSGFELLPQALFTKYNLNVKMIAIGSTNTLFLLDGVDLISANWFDEYHSIMNNGYDSNELVPFFFADYGLNFLEDGVYCLSEKARKDPQLCCDFVIAALESWTYAFDHKEETIDLVVRIAKKENQPVNRAHQRWMLSRYRELYIPKGRQSINTALSSGDYNNVSEIMLNSKLISAVIPYDSFYVPFSSMLRSDVPAGKAVGK
ncbi:MAG: ABC transporter substrate-binding protein [Bacteroidetes bacterium]|nr:ABC transporter substrate-binding protein [Bacteroidota bacterium]